MVNIPMPAIVLCRVKIVSELGVTGNVINRGILNSIKDTTISW